MYFLASRISNKDNDSECLDLQEPSELDEETLEKGAAVTVTGAAGTVTGAETSSIVSLPRVTSDLATPTLVDLGYQRAALELRNLMLEREVSIALTQLLRPSPYRRLS